MRVMRMKMNVRLMTMVSSPSDISPLAITTPHHTYGFLIMRIVRAMPRPTSSENIGATRKTALQYTQA